MARDLIQKIKVTVSNISTCDMPTRMLTTTCHQRRACTCARVGSLLIMESTQTVQGGSSKKRKTLKTLKTAPQNYLYSICSVVHGSKVLFSFE